MRMQRLQLVVLVIKLFFTIAIGVLIGVVTGYYWLIPVYFLVVIVTASVGVWYKLKRNRGK